MIEFVHLTFQQRVKLSSIIELVWERTAWQNTQMLLALRCYEAAAGQAELIEPANPWRGDSGQAEANHCRLKHCWAYLDSFWNLKGYYIIIFTLSRSFCPKPLTAIHAYIHTLMVVAANQHIRSSLRFSILPKDTLHSDQGSWTSDLLTTRCWLYTWATAAPNKGDYSISRSNSCLRDMFRDGLNTHTARLC